MDAGQKWSEKLTEALILLRWANLPGTIKQGYMALGRRSEKGCGFPMMLDGIISGTASSSQPFKYYNKITSACLSI